MGVTERETDLIIDSIKDIRDVLAKSIGEVRISLTQMEKRLDYKFNSVNILLNAHDARLDDNEKKIVEFQIWHEAKEKEEERQKHAQGIKEARLTWLVPLLATFGAGIVSLIIRLWGMNL